MRDEKTIAERLNELSTRLCETASLMSIVCIAAAEATETPESMPDSFRCCISPTLDGISRTLMELWEDAENLEYTYKDTHKNAPQPTADQSNED